MYKAAMCGYFFSNTNYLTKCCAKKFGTYNIFLIFDLQGL